MQFPLPPSFLPAQAPAQGALPPTPTLTTEPYSFPRLDVKPKENGDFELEDIDLSLANKSGRFEELCKRYRLAHYGTKAARRDRLIKFSLAGMDQWKSSFFQPTRIAHKGVRDGRVTKRKPTPRAARILGTSSLSNLSTTKFLPVERSKDTRSDAEINSIIPWAESLVAKMAQVPPQPLRHTHLPERRINSATGAMGMQTMAQKLIEPSLFLNHINAFIEEQLSVRLASSTIMEPAPSPASGRSSIDINCLGITAHSTDIIPMAICPDSPTLPHPAIREGIPPSSSPSSQMMPTSALSSISEVRDTTSVLLNDVVRDYIQCTLKLANGVTVVIKRSDVPPTTPFCYADMANLIASWDDCSPDWAPPPNHPIVIHGYPIPVKYFQHLYRRNSGMSDEWKRLKNDWTNWRYFMRAYKASTPGAFWARFSNNQGRRLPFSRITKLLMEERMAADADLATRARQEYGEEFDSVFGYHSYKLKRWVIMKDNSKIAQRYREKRGLYKED
ncbi:hypothetical protein EDD18DRAFT_1410385 [Armillaria luteobubalina]|uniref:SAP domain-containing protein n=1 Tax=Armillaria luteobubalina TaxID=153913 RepID=A0AA39UJZ7_9AGAR|nr:hypothetical protein EDD18DRAFT_1410385 [Armillaria luteobubalina]